MWPPLSIRSLGDLTGNTSTPDHRHTQSVARPLLHHLLPAFGTLTAYTICKKTRDHRRLQRPNKRGARFVQPSFSFPKTHRGIFPAPTFSIYLTLLTISALALAFTPYWTHNRLHTPGRAASSVSFNVLIKRIANSHGGEHCVSTYWGTGHCVSIHRKRDQCTGNGSFLYCFCFFVPLSRS